MNYKLFTIAGLAIAITGLSRAEYTVIIPLDYKALKFEDKDINGTIKLDPSTINRGQSSNIIWDYEYANKISIDGLVSYTQKSGSHEVNPLRSTIYNITVENGSKLKDEQVHLKVIQPDPEINFTANKYKIGTGESVNLSWNLKHVDSATLDNGIGDIEPNSTLTVYPVDNTTYKLTTQGYFGEKSANKLLDIIVVQNSIVNLFSVNKNKFTIGESALFSWDVKNSEKLELLPYGIMDKTKTSQAVLLNTIGNFDYSLKTTSYNNTTVSSNPISISVYGEPIISAFTVNNKKTATVEKGDDIKFDWNTTNDISTTLDGLTVAGKTSSQKATDTNKTYTLEAINGAGKSISDSVVVNIVEPVAISTLSAPSIVFNNAPFIMNWSGLSVSKYELSSTSGSGVSANENMGVTKTKSITPTSSGNYTYTLKATNLAEKSMTKTTNITVESDPTLTELVVNGQSSITVSPSTALDFSMVGASAGSSMKGRNSTGTAEATLPSVSSAAAGTTNYYASAFKTLNNVSRYSPVGSVSVTVVNAPTITSITAPTSVFEDSAFTMSWAGTNATSYKIKSNNANSGIATTDVDMGVTTTKSITPTSAGTYIYTITATNAAGVSTTSTKQVVVESLPTFTGFTVNSATAVTVSPSAALSFVGTGYSTGASLQGRNSAGTANATLPATASSTAGTTTYYASAMKTVNGNTNNSAVRSVSVTVVDAPTITSITAPTPVFSGSAFTMSWVGTNTTNYKIKGNNAASGISTSDIDVDAATTQTITPTAVGTYTYTITATNDAGVSVTSTKQVVVESLPTFTGFTVNSSTSVNVAPSASLSFIGTGYSTGATLQGRNSAGTANATLPTTASATAGTTTYYASATKTLNGVTNNSAVRSVSVTVVNAPTITSITAPTPVFSGSAFTMTWVGTNAINYKIKSNNATSGIATTDIDVGTGVTRSITPTAAGTYTYTITATNAAGVTVTSTEQVVVSGDPTISSFTANPTSVNTGGTTTLSWATTNSGSLSISGVGVVTGTSAAVAVGSTAGTNNYTLTNSKTLNGVTRTATKNTAVTVVSACRNDNSNVFQVTPIPQNGGITQVYVMWDGVTKYSQQHNGGESLTQVTGIDKAVYYRASAGVGKFAVCKR